MVLQGSTSGQGPNIWKVLQEEDPTIQKVKELVKKGQFDTCKADTHKKGKMCYYAKSQKDLVILHDLVYWREQLKDHDILTHQFMVPSKYRTSALELVHNEFGHLGIDLTTSLMQDQFY